MASLNDLGTESLQDTVDFENLPEQMGAFAPMFQPGSYRFQLPRLKQDAFEAFDSTENGKRVRVRFDSDFPLVVVQSPGGTRDKEAFHTSLSNNPRKRGKGDDAPKASDWDYLNQALGEKTRPKTNKEFAERLIKQSETAGGKTFGADVECSWGCREDKHAYFLNDQGQPYESEQNGCGQKTYQRDVQKVNGEYPERIECTKCGASVRGFANLTRFRE